MSKLKWDDVKYDEHGCVIEPEGHSYDTCDDGDCVICMAMEDDWAELYYGEVDFPEDDSDIPDDIPDFVEEFRAQKQSED